MNTSKIIKGVVNNGRYTVTAPIVKEDYGLYLQIEGVELPSTYEVDFSNDEHHGTSVTMIGNSDGVLIPSQFISSGKDVFAFLYHVGADFGRTVYKFRIPNKVRPDRTEEEPTPEEQSVIDQAISALNSAVEQTSADVASADASAQSAQGYAEQAETAKSDAQTFAQRSANSAQASADYSSSAQASATASAQSAEQSAINSADAQDSAEDAQGYAQASAQSASASANSASQAQGYAQSASSSASSAQGYASNAQSYSQTASAKAQDASQSASTASQKATEASQSASQALTYKTDAESAKTASQTAQGLAESARDTAVQAKTDAESARDEAQRIAETYDGRLTKIDGLVFPQFELGNIQISSSGWTYANSSLRIRTPQGYTVHLKEGSKISIAEGARFYCGALKSDDTYYDCGAWQTSELVLPVEGDYVICVTYLPQVTVTDVDALASMLTVYSIDNALEDIDDKIEALEDDRYKPYVVDSASGAIASFPDGADDIPLKSLVVDIDPVQDLSNGDPSPENICPISGWTGCEANATNTNLCGGSKLLANAQNYIPNGITNTEEEYFQFSSGASLDYDYRFSTGTPFKENTQYTFIFTLYKTSGTGTNLRVNYTDGSYGNIPNLSSAGARETVVYVSTAGKSIINLSKTNSSGSTRIYYNEGGIFEGVLTVSDFEPYQGQSIPINWQTEVGTVYGGKLDVLSGKLTVYPYYASYNGETLTGEWISDRDVYAVGTTPTIGAQVVNIGAQGAEYQLEPHEVKSLLGANNLWADTGDTEVEYRADTKLYINKKIAEALASLT